jgi:hypothetical protein
MTGFGGAAVKAEGAGVTYDTASEAWVSRYVFETIALAYAITEEAMEDELYATLGTKLSKALARSFQYTKNDKGANIYNNGFTSVYGGDGVVLFSASHPLTSGGTGDNLLAAADLTETALEDALITVGDLTDDRGIPMALTAVKLHVPNELQFTAQRILKNPDQPDTADRNINAIYTMGLINGGFDVNNFLTDPDAYFLHTDCADGMKYIERKALTDGMEGDFESGNLRFKKRERYAFGFSDWRGAVGSAGG